MRRIRVETLPDAKASPRPTGGKSRDNLENRFYEGKQMTTTEQRRLVRPQHHRKMMCTTAAGAYREGNARCSSSRRVSASWPSILLEPCAVKVARTVLRGLDAGDRVWLPD